MVCLLLLYGSVEQPNTDSIQHQADMASAMPTAGGLYFWTHYYAAKKWKNPLSFLVGYSNTLGLVGGICSIDCQSNPSFLPKCSFLMNSQTDSQTCSSLWSLSREMATGRPQDQSSTVHTSQQLPRTALWPSFLGEQCLRSSPRVYSSTSL
jgi:hypothetical protein